MVLILEEVVDVEIVGSPVGCHIIAGTADHRVVEQVVVIECLTNSGLGVIL